MCADARKRRGLAVAALGMQPTSGPKALGLARKEGLSFDIMSTSYFLPRRSVRSDAHSQISAWHDRVFALAGNVNAFRSFQLPTNLIVEAGTQVAV